MRQLVMGIQVGIFGLVLAASGQAQPQTKPQTSGKGSEPAGAAARSDLPDATPEDALRTFMIALVAIDEAALRIITVPVPDAELAWLLRGQAAPPEVIKELKAGLAKTPIKRLKEGERVTLPGNRVYVVRPGEVGEDKAVLLPDRAPQPTRLQKIRGHWKVSAEPFIAARKAAAAARQKKQAGAPGQQR
jgi:hypothetical protein